MKKMKILPALISICLLMVGMVYAGGLTPDQPHMVEARDQLNAANDELKVAEHNKGGHRAKAIGYVNNAITEVNKGIDYAKSHNHVQFRPEIFGASTTNPDQPHMQAALDHLNNALASLKAADPDKGGHRAKAIDWVNKAINEVNLGIAAGQ